MSDNNVVDFPQDKVVAPSPEELKAKAQKGNAVILNMIQKNRAAGLQRADSAIKSLDDITGLASEPNVEARLRALETAVRGLTTALDAVNNLSDILGKDLVSLLMNLDQQMAAGALYGMHLQTLLDTIKSKGLVTDEELQSTWTRLQAEMRAPKQAAPVNSVDESSAQ